MHSSRVFSFLDKDTPRPRYLEGFWRRQARKIEALLSHFASRERPARDEGGTIVRFTIQKGKGIPKLPKQRISFFELPAEVRNTIYHYALSVPEGLPIGVERIPHLGPPLLSASARIREEGSIIYYRSNEFQAQDVDCAVDFLKSLCVCALPLLRAIRIPLHSSHGGDFTQYLSQEQVQRHHLCWRLLQSGLFSAGLRDDCIFLGFDNHYYDTTASHYCENLPVSLLYLSRYKFDLLDFMMTSSPPKNWSDVHVMRAIVKNSESPRMLPDARLTAAQRHAFHFPCKDLCEDCLQSPEAMANPQVLYCESKLHCQTELPPTPECPGSYHVPVAAHLNKHFIDVPGQSRSKSRMASRVRCAKCDDTTRRTLLPWLRFAGKGARR